MRATLMENAGLVECDRELSKEEIEERFAYDKHLKRTMDLLLTSNRPLASFSVARYVVEQPEVSKPAFLRALHLTAYAVAEYGGVPESAKDIIEKLRAKADTMKSDVMQPMIRSLFDSMSDTPLRIDADDGNVPAVGAVTRDLYAIQACAALRRRDIDGYRALSASRWKPIHADRALYETASRLAREDAVAARQILDEDLGAFSRRGQPITAGDFEQFTKPFLGLRPEWRLDGPGEPFEDKCTGCGEKLKPAQTMPQPEFEALKREIENVIFKEVVSRRGGSPREVEALRRHVEIERQNRLRKPNV
ncbi:hypothetical protein AAVH_38748 [Aphelenchoides avenae]|nr:hypothetical protein AAVH_38748 [Aphelenchus avenae]